MVNPIELIVSESSHFYGGLEIGIRQRAEYFLHMALSYCYARTTNQYEWDSMYHISPNPGGLNLSEQKLACEFLKESGYAKVGKDGAYELTDKGMKFMEEYYSGQELWGVKIK